ncbi:alpha-ketoglutaric semialdehyde dehydrogenase/NADP-dependent aldehyde dehydrogenase [Amycolatopsis marina]|uniref:Alpha-ketoglutaric semialdehyde dehydrogenase/NADP-dependent aldehyde dehydrogenase n=1 Tax=Amycolatopsis marina TaxID=490629 RepID=A0A1I0VNC8_9PSEU|nr:alpha-ketoglutaric semialdehyde dehydrogenase/NADP-dependent aldehyde dehydrogenase [Amycolatopsis marina]
MRAAQGTGFVAGNEYRGRGQAFRALDPATGDTTGPEFTTCEPDEVAEAAKLAWTAFETNRERPERWQAPLLREIASRLGDAREAVLATARAETGISSARLEGELARTRNQLLGFADVVEREAFGEPVHDEADPEATPPRPDLRRVLIPIGPVAVFGASNFPLAFSVAGGDTAAALAAGCPVLVKAHPSHPGTSELVGACVAEAVAACGLHPGTFALLQGAGNETGSALVTAPEVRAVGFTGSFGGGRALTALAAERPRPIPVFAEMGSLNPMFVTAAVARERLDSVVQGFVTSMTFGAGQLCTKPGVVLTTEGREFATRAAALLDEVEPGILLNQATKDAFEAGTRISGVEVLTKPCTETGEGLRAAPVLVLATLADLRREPALLEEHFGPFAVVVDLDSEDDFAEAASLLPGSLTATVHSEPEDHERLGPLVFELVELAGRIVHNGYPTGVSVSGAQTHGGPFPASSDSAHTSVGWTAIRRFQRPVTFQDVPETLLPPVLRTALLFKEEQ